VTGRFGIEHVTADAATLHEFRPPRTGRPTLVVGEVTAPALVLGSTQPDTHADPARAVSGGYEIVRRRSGGGSVWLAPGAQVWVDVWLPAGDPWWDDDVARAAVPVGEAWRSALEVVGLGDGFRVHQGGVESRPWSALVCFAGIGPGEVLDRDGRKWVGISQRRTRDWIRLQTMAHRRWSPVDAVDGLLGHEGPDAALADAVGEIHGADVLAALIPALG
jgi:lipoate-protein ligase A